MDYCKKLYEYVDVIPVVKENNFLLISEDHLNFYFHKKRLVFAFNSIKVIIAVIRLGFRDIIDLASVCYHSSNTSLHKELHKTVSV